MNDEQIYNLSQEQAIIKKVTVEMLRVAHYLAILSGGAPTANQKGFALQAFLNPAGYVNPFIYGVVLDAAVQAAGTSVSDATVATIVAGLWPVLWA